MEYTTKIIENIFSEIIFCQNNRIDRTEKVDISRKYELNYLYALVLFLHQIDKLKDNLFSIKNNLFELSIYTEDLYPFDFLCEDLGLERRLEVGISTVYTFHESSEQVELFLEILSEKIIVKEKAIEDRLFGFLKKDQFLSKSEAAHYKHLSKEFFPLKVNKLSVENGDWLNEIVAAYKSDQRNIKAKVVDKKFIQKYISYCDYFEQILSDSGEFLVFSIHFIAKNLKNYNKISLGSIKQQFLNYLRGYKRLSLIAGYMGYWELDSNNQLAFRIYFIVPNTGIEALEWQKDIIYYWENIFFRIYLNKNNLQGTNLTFNANIMDLLLSHKKFKCKSIVVSRRRKGMTKDFCQTVVAYIVLSELYFNPHQLQIWLHTLVDFDTNQDQSSIIDITSKNKISKVFRGHFKNNSCNP